MLRKLAHLSLHGCDTLDGSFTPSWINIPTSKKCWEIMQKSVAQLSTDLLYVINMVSQMKAINIINLYFYFRVALTQ
jgi:hypothetical protein